MLYVYGYACPALGGSAGGPLAVFVIQLEPEILEFDAAVDLHEVVRVVVHDVVQVDLDPFAVEGMAAVRVDHLALRVHRPPAKSPPPRTKSPRRCAGWCPS